MMWNSTLIVRYQRAAGRCEAAEEIGRTHRGAVRPKGERVEAERELAVKRVGYAPAKASTLQSAHGSIRANKSGIANACFRLFDEDRRFFYNIKK